MTFKKFTDFLKEKNLEENTKLNMGALDYDKKLAQFNARFNDPKQAQEVLQSSGYSSVSAFLNDPDDKKWSKLRIPGQGNYTKR